MNTALIGACECLINALTVLEPSREANDDSTAKKEDLLIEEMDEEKYLKENFGELKMKM